MLPPFFFFLTKLYPAELQLLSFSSRNRKFVRDIIGLIVLVCFKCVLSVFMIIV